MRGTPVHVLCLAAAMCASPCSVVDASDPKDAHGERSADPAKADPVKSGDASTSDKNKPDKGWSGSDKGIVVQGTKSGDTFMDPCPIRPELPQCQKDDDNDKKLKAAEGSKYEDD